MISVSDLLKWADEHAIGRSPSYPRGWVRASDLLVFARLVTYRHERDIKDALYTPTPSCTFRAEEGE